MAHLSLFESAVFLFNTIYQCLAINQVIRAHTQIRVANLQSILLSSHNQILQYIRHRSIA